MVPSEYFQNWGKELENEVLQVVINGTKIPIIINEDKEYVEYKNLAESFVLLKIKTLLLDRASLNVSNMKKSKIEKCY